jgi:hypothetical protein
MRRGLILATAAAALWLAPSAVAAPWCGGGSVGADRLPELVTGKQVHVLYVTPADAPDNFGTFANSIADDADQIDSWWRSQDFTRTVRFDRYAFPSCDAGGGLDISDVRLSRAASDFYGQASRYVLIRDTLRGIGWTISGKKYLVYYDGPVDTPNLCGQGGGEFAIVFAQSCVKYTSLAVVAAHELLHTLGAVPRQAPHVCVDTGHVCGDTYDIMNPYSSAYRKLTDYGLDIGHDDYYAHSGTWLDVQDSPWLHLLQAPTYPVTVQIQGGSAVVTSDLPGITCSSSCTTTWDAGTPFRLSVTPGPGLRLIQWTGGCTGAGDCDLVADGAKSVTAVLGPATIKLRIAIKGRGRVGGDARCALAICTRAVDGGDGVFLNAQPAKGWRFAGWSGGCRGRGECSPSTDADVAVTARFVKLPVAKKHRA